MEEECFGKAGAESMVFFALEIFKGRSVKTDSMIGSVQKIPSLSGHFG